MALKERSTASNASRSVYEVAWDCNMELTGRGMRGELALDVAVQDFGCVTLPIMAKVYKSSDTSAIHGEHLGNLSVARQRSVKGERKETLWLSQNLHRSLMYESTEMFKVQTITTIELERDDPHGGA